VKYVIAGVSAALILTCAQIAVSASSGQSVSTNNWVTTEAAAKCVVDATAALTTAGFKHVSSGKTHKDGSVVLFADQDTYQAVIFCLDKYITVEVTGPRDAKTSSLVDAFVKAWNAE